MGDFQSIEYIPKELYNLYGDKGMRYINPKIPLIMQAIRTFMGKPITINNWFDGGDRNGSCLRLPSNKDYTQWSDHSMGNACDFIVSGMDSLEVQKIITKSALTGQLINLGLTSIEDGTQGWTHIGVSNLDGWNLSKVNGVYLIPIPKK